MAVSLEEYFRTTFEDKLLVKMPEREDDHLTPATRLLEKRREMAEVKQALDAQKEEFQMKMESLQQRRGELEKRECELKEALLNFDHFLKEEKSSLVMDKDKLQGKLERYMIYQKYMEKVLEAGDEFHEMRDIIARHDTLVATHEDLLERDQKNQEEIEKQRQDLAKYKESKKIEILGFNNQLSGLQTKLDTAQSEAVKWESRWTHIKNTAAKKTLQLGKIKMATHNLYQLVKKHQKQAAGVEETSEQLHQIQMFLEDLTDIVKDLKKSDTYASSYAPLSSA
ncbi:hypothetical protein KUTeg_009482 [Tegillarca granosa]|uniref:DUF4200 domain-containing protein n=1 Tax=Tegillarca granosa TaxID=220873 RepID=A0ABQ9F404_TEGGR|nr:hypothetical protein KUTeg_009482 [Tegillarca granosa]